MAIHFSNFKRQPVSSRFDRTLREFLILENPGENGDQDPNEDVDPNEGADADEEYEDIP